MFARDCRTPADYWTQRGIPLSREYEKEIKKYLEYVQRTTKLNIQNTQRVMKERYDRHRQNPTYEPGDQVVVMNSKPKNKVSPKYIGPYSVIRRVGNKGYRVQFQTDGPMYQVTVDRMRLVKRGRSLEPCEEYKGDE